MAPLELIPLDMAPLELMPLDMFIHADELRAH